ncbi:MAG: SUMF1/EgtB/PvdO family nonheme iron enzyme [Deltaproteobacteria bacterium]|nr:SUMF1/EgtB/PvdO family nonheme iron enzyme [Deltaproteobacteria bacterium]
MIALLALLVAVEPTPATWDEPMVVIPAGTFERGSDDAVKPDQRPRQRVAISTFDLDQTLVTVAAFRAFVAATGHRTSAERLGYGMVAVEGMKDWEWRRVDGATWRLPFNGLAQIKLADDLPVTMVSHVDGDAFCRFMGKRLPTEAEWEYAMRAGSTERFPWGPSPRRPDGRYGLNHWQGSLKNEHEKNDVDDGFMYLSPVRAFPPNAWGVFDPVGNVWQLVADWYDPAAYRKGNGDVDGVAHDPRGPASGTRRVTRGGSWWCSARTCAGFGLSFRGKNVSDAPYNNVGFRCAKSSTVKSSTLKGP